LHAVPLAAGRRLSHHCPGVAGFLLPGPAHGATSRDARQPELSGLTYRPPARVDAAAEGRNNRSLAPSQLALQLAAGDYRRATLDPALFYNFTWFRVRFYLDSLASRDSSF
jgi:hypothetical protein